MPYTEKQEQFINDCRDQINDDPATRLSPVVRDILANNNYVFDNHCHIFDGGCVDVSYFILRVLAEIPGNLARKVFRRLLGGVVGLESFEDDEKPFNIEEIIYSDHELINARLEFDGAPTDFLEILDERAREAVAELESEQIEMESYEESIFQFSLRELYRRIRNIISILKSKSMDHVLTVYESQYGINRLLPGNPDLITVVLGMDLNKGWGYGSTRSVDIEKSQSQQNNELKNLSEDRAILPFFPVDPRRADDVDPNENLYDNFIKAFTGDSPFYGVKVYPALGYHPADSRLDPIFKICAEKKIPVLTHCGGTSVSTFQKNITVDIDGNATQVPGNTRQDKAHWLNAPNNWKPVLEKHPTLHLNLAHFGGVSQWHSTVLSQRVQDIIDLMNEYQVYSDFSFNINKELAIKNFTNALKANNATGQLLKERSLFGTDYWVILPGSNLNEDQQNFIQDSAEMFTALAKTNSLKYLFLSE